MNFRLAALLLSVVFVCCNKNEVVKKPPAPFAFTTTYDSVHTCYAESNTILYFTINVLGGDINDNPVTYSVTGLPPQATVVPAAQTVRGLLGGAFTISFGNTPVGTYTANFTISSSSTGTRVHKLILNVNPPKDYGPTLAGTYNNSYDFCQPDSFFYYSSVVSTVPDTPYLIKISNIKNLGASVKIRALLSKTITVPVQYAGGYTIWGRGTYTKDSGTNYRLMINDTMVKGIDTQLCTIHIEH
jgi:hypothetical protein